MKKSTKKAEVTAKKKESAKKSETKTEAPGIAKIVEGVKEKTKEIKPKKSERDETQYKFNGETLGKGRFLLAMVSAWAKAHKSATPEAIEKAWPHLLIHRYGVIVPLKEAVERSNPRKRYFIDEADVIECGGKKWAVCNQITSVIIEKIIAHAKEMGLKVK